MKIEKLLIVLLLLGPFIVRVLGHSESLLWSAQQNPIQIDANGLTQTLTAGGLVVRGQIVKLNSSGQVVPVLTTDTSGAIGIAATSQVNSGYSVSVSLAGSPLVQIDASGCAAGNIVSISSTTAGAGHCAAIATGQQIGVASSVSSPGSVYWVVQLSFAGGGGGSSPAAGTTIYAWDPKYNLKASAKWVCDATFTNNSPTVTTPSTDRPFLSTDSFAIVVGGAALCGGNAQQSIATLTPANATATFVSAHTITLSGNALATCTPTVSQGGCALFWGPDDTTALQNAFNDAANNCGTLVMPAGGIIVNALVSNTTSLCPVTDSGDDKESAVTIMGQGPFSTMLLFTPNVSFTSPMFSWGNTTFLQRTNMHDFGVASFTAATAVMAGQTGFKTGFNSEFYNLWFLDFFTSNANQFFALVCNGVTNAVTNCHNLMMINSGENAIVTNSQDVNIYACWLQGSSALIGGTIGGGPNSSLVTRDNRFTISGTLGAAGVSSGTFVWHSYGDRFNSSGTSLPGVNINGNAGTTVDFHDVQITGSQTTGPSLSIAAGNTVTIDGDNNVVSASTGTANAITNAGTLIMRNTTVSSTGGTGLSNSGTVTFQAGNSISNGVTNTGTFNGQAGQGSYQGACTGVVTSATTVGLYGLGQQTATTCTNTTVGSGIVMGKAGSVYALYCTATAGNQVTDACTVVKNGAAQTMTCSLNGVTSCTDGTAAHVVTFVQGDILSIEAIGGTTTTLANVKGTLVTN